MTSLSAFVNGERPHYDSSSEEAEKSEAEEEDDNESEAEEEDDQSEAEEEEDNESEAEEEDKTLATYDSDDFERDMEKEKARASKMKGATHASSSSSTKKPLSSLEIVPLRKRTHTEEEEDDKPKKKPTTTTEPHIPYTPFQSTIKKTKGPGVRSITAFQLQPPRKGFDGEKNRRILEGATLRSRRITEDQYHKINRFYALAPKAFWNQLTMNEFVLDVAQGSEYFTKDAHTAFVDDMASWILKDQPHMELSSVRMANSLMHRIFKQVEDKLKQRKLQYTPTTEEQQEYKRILRALGPDHAATYLNKLIEEHKQNLYLHSKKNDYLLWNWALYDKSTGTFQRPELVKKSMPIYRTLLEWRKHMNTVFPSMKTPLEDPLKYDVLEDEEFNSLNDDTPFLTEIKSTKCARYKPFGRLSYQTAIKGDLYTSAAPHITTKLTKDEFCRLHMHALARYCIMSGRWPSAAILFEKRSTEAEKIMGEYDLSKSELWEWYNNTWAQVLGVDITLAARAKKKAPAAAAAATTTSTPSSA